MARKLLVLVVALMLAGCQLLPVDEQGADPDEEAEVMETAESVDEADPPPATLQAAIDRLETGRIDQAEAILLRVLDANPGQSLALRFLEQIQTDPVELMGEDYRTVTIEPGESLSAVASRELDDPLQFFALARYNDIPVPRLVAPGTELRVPEGLVDAPAAEPIEHEPEPPVEPSSPGAGLAETGRALVESGRYRQAIAMLSAAARADNLDSDGELALADAAIGRSEQLWLDDNLEGALSVTDSAVEMVGNEAAEHLRPQRERLRARKHYREAAQAREAEDLQRALALLQQAVTLDPSFEAASSDLAEVSEARVSHLHERALNAYRDQSLDTAIELWERIVELDATFEPAQVYLERAIALRERLGELDS